MTALPGLDALPFGIFVTDEKLRLVQVNRWLLERLPDLKGKLGRSLDVIFPTWWNGA